MWTKESIKSLIESSNPVTARKAIERGVIAIYERQTADEKSTETTRHHNHVGFQACDARRGSYYAKWVISGKHLTGLHFDKAKAIVTRYAGQLAQIANEKAETQCNLNLEQVRI